MKQVEVVSPKDPLERSPHAPIHRGDVRVLGIDPGLQVTGYGIIEVQASRFKLIEAGLIRSNPADSLEDRLAALFDGVREVMADMRPDVAIIEELYSTYRHPRTAILMGHARGIIFLAAAQSEMAVISYLPTEMKRAITGNGRASKVQVQRTVQQRLRLRSLPSPPDVADALALALCHGIRIRTAH